ncbi:MAG TPA: hypothetical protein K8V84_07000 [Nocardiopsis listeri]|uniref:hypothetical protein n=1 Tax=Nocardiopsis listeri TaxID=53440 RepID=UPI001D3D7698|nr:hypothetical protein [Nocardiopsis listeri]HJE58250.1 hypothetical protein [Nocardiopsis listeri]
MESIGVPWFIVVRYLGPPLFLVLAGGALLWWRRPPRAVMAWTALVVNLFAAALPFLWIGVQSLTGQGDLTVIGLVMTLLQPAVVVIAWSLLLVAFVGGPRERSVASETMEDGEATETAPTPQNV